MFLWIFPRCTLTLLLLHFSPSCCECLFRWLNGQHLWIKPIGIKIATKMGEFLGLTRTQFKKIIPFLKVYIALTATFIRAPVGAVLRRTRPNAICIPNQGFHPLLGRDTGHNQKQWDLLRGIINQNWYYFCIILVLSFPHVVVKRDG